MLWPFKIGADRSCPGCVFCGLRSHRITVVAKSGRGRGSVTVFAHINGDYIDKAIEVFVIGFAKNNFAQGCIWSARTRREMSMECEPISKGHMLAYQTRSVGVSKLSTNLWLRRECLFSLSLLPWLTESGALR